MALSGPRNVLLFKKRQEQPMPVNPPACPFTIAADEAKSIVASDGSPNPITVRFSPCIGSRCMAFTIIQEPDGKHVGACLRLLPTQTLDQLAGMVEALVRLKKAELDAAGIKVEDPRTTPTPVK